MFYSARKDMVVRLRWIQFTLFLFLAFNNPHMNWGEFSCKKLKLSKLKEWFEMEIV